jgi:hypothetical protein
LPRRAASLKLHSDLISKLGRDDGVTLNHLSSEAQRPAHSQSDLAKTQTEV